MKRIIATLSLFRIVFFYLLFGGLWIAVSDRVLALLVSDEHKLTILQTYKGWFFVAASALLLYLVAQREFKSREQSEAALRDSEEKWISCERRVVMPSGNRIDPRREPDRGLTGGPRATSSEKHSGFIRPGSGTAAGSCSGRWARTIGDLCVSITAKI
jgi:hypothetical protein